MASPFVPVDLDKLLDEFEEKEEESKLPEQVASSVTSDTDRKQRTRQSFQAPFPSIEEEVFSDQGLNRRISDDKSDSSSDSDSDSINGVIEAAEAITNQRSSWQLQNTQVLVVDENINDKLKRNVAIVDDAPSVRLDGTIDASNTIENGNSGHFDLDDEKQLDQYGYGQLLSEETKSETVLGGVYASENPGENVEPSKGDVSAPSVLCSEMSPELNDKHMSSGAGDHERHWIDENKFNTKRSTIDIGQDNALSTSDPIWTPAHTMVSDSSHSHEDKHYLNVNSNNEPSTPHSTSEASSDPNGTPAETMVSGSSHSQDDEHYLKVNRHHEPTASHSTSEATSDPNWTPAETMVSGSSHSQDDEHYLNVNRHHEPTASHSTSEATSDPNWTPAQTTVSGSSQSQDDEHYVNVNRHDEPTASHSTSEATSDSSWTPVQTTVSGSSQSQDEECYMNAYSHGEPSMSSQDQSQTLQAGNSAGTSNVPITTTGYEFYETPGEAQAICDNQGGASSHETQGVPSQGEASTDFNQVYEADDLDAGTLPISDELDERAQSPSQSPEPDLSITMQSQGSALEAQRITAGEANLGKVPPLWVPDSVATHCMNCGLKFSVIKRRHHCRACGKALCSSCCNMKFLLPYLDNKEGRVCQVCCNTLLRAQALLQVDLQHQSNEYLRHDDESPTEDLMLDDGLEEDEEVPDEQQEIVEGTEAVGDEDVTDYAAAEVDVSSEHTAPILPPLELPVAPPSDTAGTPLSTPTSPALSDDSDCLFRLDLDNVRSLLPQDITALPPVLKVTNEEISIQERPDPAEIMCQLKGLHETVVFLLNKNLVVKVSIVKLSCCVKRKCWCFVTEGMGAANQEEMVVLLECLRKETMLPKDVLSHFNTAFAYAKQGHTVSELGYTIFGQPFLGSSDNAGFLYIKPTYQCLKHLPLPSTPYVVGILLKRLETPWAQLFPLRLQLRLGAEYRYYPCPLFSSRNRPAVYGEVGHTIMNLLVDFKNLQYTLGRVTGLVIHMEEKKTLVRLPQDRYDEVVKILNAADEHVMALGANFSLQADSHLVCIQNEQGYKTQAINIQNQARKVTGASFIIFSGALKTSSPFMAKVNIVEDGIMVQLTPEMIGKLRNSLKEMKDFTITTGIPGGGGEEQVIVEWVSRQDAPHQSSLCSPIDGLQLDSFPSVKVHSGCDFTRKNVFRIQWTEMFFLGEGQQSASRDLNKLTAELAKAFCRTLMSHLSKLSSDGFTFIGLRVNLDSENVGYSTGSNQQGLPGNIMSDLDDVLVPVIHSAASHHRSRTLNVELLFKVLRLL